jgi:hypothetical protein
MSGLGVGIGSQIGLHSMLAFTFIAQPGRWMFADWQFGRAMIAYGYSIMAWVLLCSLVGGILPALIRRTA